MTKQNKALCDLVQSEIEAREFGFDWTNTEMIIDQAISECEEIRQAIAENEPSHRLQEEIGDLLHTAVSICLFAGFDVEETLAKVNIKFNKRMQAIKNLTKQAGLSNLKGQSMVFMLDLWKQAKKRI